MNQSLGMATPTESQTNSDALAAQQALVAAANTAWIADMDAAIAQAVAQGKFSASALLGPNVSGNDISTYYMNLGYQVAIPGSQPWYWQPVDLFGQAWTNYWAGSGFFAITKPCRIRISWR